MITIIGGGPAGCMAAYALQKKGFSTQILEEHSEIGRPVQCTGIVTKDILSIIKPDIIINRIKTARLHSQKNRLDLPIDDLVIDRAAFDRQIGDIAESEGAMLHLNTHVQSISKNHGISIKTSKDEIQADLIIGADGPSGKVRNLIPNPVPRFFYAKQALCKGAFDEDMFDVYLDAAPGFFAWVVPEDRKTARIGLASTKNPNPYFSRFIKKVAPKKVISTTGGLIPIYNPKRKTEMSGAYLVGDAAGHVKATTGGGLVPGLMAAKVLAESISQNESHEKNWRKKIGTELWIHLKTRQMLDSFSPIDYDNLLAMLSEEKHLFRRYSRDQMLSLMLALAIRKPGLIRFVPKVFQASLSK